MARINLSTKRLQIGKANSTIVAVTAIAGFVTTFSLVASQALLSQRSYQAKIINKKEQALQQLKQNETAVESLVNSYKLFVTPETGENIIKGLIVGEGERDGDNAKIILDALPSSYDYPALVTSLEKLLVERNFSIEGITGVDLGDAAEQAGVPNPAPIEMPFELKAKSNFQSFRTLLEVFERSIRPFHVTALQFEGSGDSVEIKVSANTYFKPPRTLDITTEEVR